MADALKKAKQVLAKLVKSLKNLGPSLPADLKEKANTLQGKIEQFVSEMEVSDKAENKNEQSATLAVTEQNLDDTNVNSKQEDSNKALSEGADPDGDPNTIQVPEPLRPKHQLNPAVKAQHVINEAEKALQDAMELQQKLQPLQPNSVQQNNSLAGMQPAPVQTLAPMPTNPSAMPAPAQPAATPASTPSLQAPSLTPTLAQPGVTPVPQTVAPALAPLAQNTTPPTGSFTALSVNEAGETGGDFPMAPNTQTSSLQQKPNPALAQATSKTSSALPNPRDIPKPRPEGEQ